MRAAQQHRVPAEPDGASISGRIRTNKPNTMTHFQTITIFVLASCGLYAANICAESQAQNQHSSHRAYRESIPPEKLKEDLDFLLKSVFKKSYIYC